MLIGVPKEIKIHEYRVGLTPESVAELIIAGQEVMVETGAGLGIGAGDADYKAAGATIAQDAASVFAKADMIVKVKEPQAVCIAYETVTDDQGDLPLLKPMSQVAGRLAVQVGATALQKDGGGRGVLLGGVPGVAPAKVIVIGGGDVGFNAAQMAVGLQAEVTILDRDNRVMEELSNHFGNSAKVIRSTPAVLAELVKTADMVVGAVLIPGAAAPKLITKDMLSTMMDGSVLVDVAIDQGGCFETSKPTTHADPTYIIDGVVHYCVANMPGAVARTSTYALNAATLGYAKNIARMGWKAALAADEHLLNGLNVCEGKLTYAAVGEALGIETVDPKTFL